MPLTTMVKFIPLFSKEDFTTKTRFLAYTVLTIGIHNVKKTPKNDGELISLII